MGDYVDSLTIPPNKVLENLRELIRFKRKHSSKVTLLLGNHDMQYMEYPEYGCGGFNPIIQPTLTKIFRRNKNLFQVAKQIDDYLFTHAGLSHSFVKNYLKEYYESIVRKEIRADKVLNQIQHSDKQAILHTVSELRAGDDPFGGITWADYDETSTDILPGYHQVVGHSRMKKIIKREGTNCSITYIDILDVQKEFLLITKNKTYVTCSTQQACGKL